MNIAFKIPVLVFILLFLFSNVFCQERNYSINTSAGNLSISSTAGELNCVIKLGRKVIRTFECEYSPQVLKYIKQSISPFDEVIVFVEKTTAQSCENKDVFFLGLNSKGTYEFSDSIDYCGGPKPLITASSGKVTITFPAFKAFNGGFIRRQVWIYEKGKIRQIKK